MNLYLETYEIEPSRANSSTLSKLFSTKKNSIRFLFTEKKSCILVVVDGIKTGELWLRYGISTHRRPFYRGFFCESYVYRRLFLDEGTARLEETSAGVHIIPHRTSDLLCMIDKKEMLLSLRDGDNDLVILRAVVS
jgi:hypothetical protein